METKIEATFEGLGFSLQGWASGREGRHGSNTGKYHFIAS